ncbi:MAG: hypothetical protein K6E10_03955 [Eubacterium sp.]|nr:hypothetical protein [Eubacterium sp.]
MNNLELIKKYKTPFYLYDIGEVKKRLSMMREHQGDIGLCFAMKAAPLLAGYIHPYVDRLEVCSPGEYEICARDNIKPEQILVSGVNKTYESMTRILSLGGAKGYFTIESPEHFNILEKCASDTRISQRLKCYVRLTSGNQFGVDKASLEALCQKIIDSEYLDLMGIHYFSGTQKSLKKIEKELILLSQYGNELKEKYGRGLSLEYGPGLGIDYFLPKNGEGKNESDNSSYDNTSCDKSDFDNNLYLFNESDLTKLMDLVEKTGIRKVYSDITFEYGRYIAASCGKYFTGIADVKTSDGTNYAILEGGIHHITYYGSMAGMKIPYIDYIKTSDRKAKDLPDYTEDYRDYVLAGSLCSINDIVVRNICLPRLDIGDTLCFNLTGAYSATEGMALFLSRDIPAIIVRDIEGKEIIVRNHIETNTFNGGFNN